MYIESSSRIENQTARLFSPLYRGNISDGCFVFFYHMYGRSIGTLNIYMKPEGVEVRTILENPDIYKMFEKSMDQGNVWHMGFFYLNSTSESFQVNTTSLFIFLFYKRNYPFLFNSITIIIVDSNRRRERA